MATGHTAPVTGDQPPASRPHMPGYGVLGPGEGTGLLAWAWAEQRLTAARNYWLATVWPDGRPHVMPVWGVWHERTFWFSTGGRSRKARNLADDPRCTVATDDALEPVVVEGSARVVADADALAAFLERVNAKYETSYGLDLVDPAVNATVQVAPVWAFALTEDDFNGSPTRWRLSPA